MASNRFGTLFCITTWGESHGKAIGVVIDGCPAGLALSEEIINQALIKRRPGSHSLVSPRREEDRAEIYSGIFEGYTTGAPISIVIFNKDADSSPYDATRHLLRPGHANYPYLEKYGIFDHRGGGRASARETACRVAAGAVANEILKQQGVEICAFVQEIGGITCSIDEEPLSFLQEKTHNSPTYCPDPAASVQFAEQIALAQAEGDSLGGVVEVRATGIPAGWGDPVYEKLDALLAKAFLSIPACKGFEGGSGFHSCRKRGSEQNDLYALDVEGRLCTSTNHAGGVLAGISTGMPLIARAAFKPPSSIRLPQSTLTVDHQPDTLHLPPNSRHDPCVCIRAVPVIEAMTALVLVDALLLQRCARLQNL